MMPSITSIAWAKPRPSTWLAVSHGSEGLNAPIAVRTHPSTVASISVLRRPRSTAKASMPPRRTAAPATPWARLPAPNSSAANAIVSSNIVLSQPRTMATIASVPRIDAARASSRTAGAHHAFRPFSPPRATSRRIAHTNIQAK